MDIIVDSREQKPLFNNNKIDTVEIKALKTGDYSISGFEDKIAIERKSLLDLFGTLTGGHKRFKKELERAKELDYFAIVIEGTYRQIRDKDFKGSYHTRMKGFIINKIVFTLIVKYGIHIFFASDRREAKSITRELLSAYWRSKNGKK